MTQLTMYSGVVNSPTTTLYADITDSATTIPVNELGVFPAAPNIATIGTDVTAETVLYTGKSATDGSGNLTGVTREWNKTGTYGAKKAWVSGELIGRNFGAYDADTFKANIEDLSANVADLSANKAPLASPVFTGNVTIPSGTHSITIKDYFALYPMGASRPSSNTANPPIDKGETAGGNTYVYGVFTDGGTETLQWTHVFPDDWNGDDATLGKIVSNFGWTAASGSGTVKWVLKGKIFPNDAALDTALVEIGNATDTLITAGDQHLSPATTAAVISPVAAGGKKVVFEVSRDSANDTLNATALLLEVPIQFIRTLT